MQLFRTGGVPICTAIGLGLLFSVNGAVAASVEAGVGYTSSFAVQPAAADWSTFSRAGGGGDGYEVDGDVNTNIIASGVTAQTTADPGNPPAANGNATWSSSGSYLQTRPTGNRYTALMGTFVNNTGTNATEIAISYLLTITGGGPDEDPERGTRVYYSLTGAANSWTNLPAFNTTAAASSSSTRTTNLVLNWPNGGTLYLLWADDNASGIATDSANQIDDFSLQVTAGLPLSFSAALTAPTNNAAFATGSPVVTAAILANGTGPFSVEYFTNSGAGNTSFASAGSVSTPPYNVTLAGLSPGAYNIFTVATDSATPPALATTATNTFLVADPISFALTTPTDNTTVDTSVPITAAATVSGGTEPYSVQFYLDGVANGPPITSTPYERNLGTLFVGDHTIRATVTDANGWVSNSAIHTVHISGPLGAALTPTNGASYSFGQSIELNAAIGGGTGPYSAAFYTNDQLAVSLSSPPFLVNLGVLSVGSYTSYVHATDSSAPQQQADSTTNVFTIAPNPIVVSVTSPSNGQTVQPNVTVNITANASVSAPLTITNVQFFYDGSPVGSDSTPPFAGSAPSGASGSHTVFARAADSLGRSAYSATNQITVASTGPPPNDLFVNAIPLSGPTVTTYGSNLRATKQFGGEPFQVAGNFGGASVWWTWTAIASGPTTIDTMGSDFNTLLGVFTGTAANQLTSVAENNDFGGTQQSRVQFNSVRGTVYRIYVDGLRTGGGFGTVAMGNIVLNIKGVGGVNIVSPTDGMQFTFGDPIPLVVNIDTNFPSPPATYVEFYRGSLLLGSVTNEPFTLVATNSPAGSNTFSVIAYNSVGEPVQSPPVRVVVLNEGVTLLSPEEDSVFAPNGSVTVLAGATLRSGSITNIEFFVDGIKFGEDDTAPFIATWTNLTSGSHRLTAIGRSDSGGSYKSQPVNIGVAFLMMPFSSVWKYRDDGTDQGTNWIAPDFDDSTWASGPAPLGYSDSNGRPPATTNSFGPNELAKYATTYYRQAITASNLAGISNVVLIIERDDGAIVYLNGRELSRFNMPTGTVTYTNFAASNANDDGGAVFTATVDPTLFVEGTNVVAVEIHQDNGNSSDIWFQMSLVGLPVIIHNLSPVVAVTSPTNDQYFVGPASIELAAEASDSDGTVARVEFYADGIFLGQATNSPYQFTWENLPVGPHAIHAVAVDDQSATTDSEPVSIIVYDSLATPFARITSPTNGAVIEGGTNLLVTAYANAVAGVTNVHFFSNGGLIGEDTGHPYAIVWDAPFGTNQLTAVTYDANGTSGTSVVVTITVVPNTIPPTIVSVVPTNGAQVTSLTAVTVVFSEPVHGVDAADIRINGNPGTNVTGAGSRYTFQFAQPPYGAVTITWASGHGITDFGFPADLPFDESQPSAQWSYVLLDRTAPTIVARTPAPGALVTNLSEINVVFTENVTGVDAADLLVRGFPATSVSGTGSNYTFTVSGIEVGTVNVTWVTNHGIFDTSDVPNEFIGNNANATWSFTYDTRVVLVHSNSNWRFVKGFTEASTPTDAWRQPAFDDSSWSNAPAPFFFGDPYTNATIQGTFLGDMLSNYTTIFLRKEFVVENRGAITNLFLNHQSDDGFIAWLNGVVVWRYNVPQGELPYNATASAAANEPGQNGAGYILVSLTNAAVSRLVNGTNVLAIQAFNQNLTNSTDFGFNAQLYFFPLDPTTAAPRLVQVEPLPGELFYLTNITIHFNESVSGVDASDLLINGVPATGVSSTTNSVYEFSFPQPAYGTVFVTWATNHGIVDFDNIPHTFDGTAPGSTANYILLNPSSPRISSQIPLANTVITGLTSITLTFTEPVTGVDASDLLINSVAAGALVVVSPTTYTFSFPQPAFGTVTIRWALNHGITDTEASPAPFDHTRFGGQWNYTLVNPVPSVTITTPTNNTYVLAPATVSVAATASDNDGFITGIEFFEGSNSLGQDTNSPFAITWSNVVEGAYTLRAVATDNSGLRGTSPPVVLNVVTSLPIFLVRGPYLQIGSPTGGVVRWRTDKVSDGVVYYGTDPEQLTNSATEVAIATDHIVQVTGLEPDTKYYYSIGSSIQRLAGTNGPGSEYWFKTSPVPGTRRPIRIWALGDAGTAGNGAPDRQQSTRDAFYNYAAANGPADLWLMLGDNAYNSGTDTEHQRAVFDMYPTTLRNLFLWPTLGNHETSQSTTAETFPYLDIFSLPRSGEAGGVPSGTEKYYSFDYANIHFVCLDSMTSGRTGDTPMARWLEDDLGATAQEWIIVFFHHPPYTKGSHDSDAESDLAAIRQNLVPIMERYGVDLVLSGHSHCWERSYLLHGHYGFSSTISESMKLNGGDGREESDGAYIKNQAGQGVVYTVAGSSGQATGGQLNHPAHFSSLNELGSMVIEVNGDRLDGFFLHANGTTPDHFTLIKPDLRPAAPLNLLARAGSATEIALFWTPGGTNELGFGIERSTDGVNFTEQLSAPAGSTNALDSGLMLGATYYYRVRATNASGVSRYSNIAAASTVAATEAPRAPAALVVRADDGVEFYRSQMLLRWQDRSTNEAGFQIERSSDGFSFVALTTVGANITYFQDSDLASATPYYYRVRAFNSVGITLPSNMADEMTHPQNQIALVGDTVMFHAGSEGVTPIRYQWRFMEVAIPGETNETLLVNNVQAGDEGDYSVVITDAAGELISNPAYLLVLVPPRITLQPQDRLDVAGYPVTLSVAAEGTAPLSYQWRKNGSPIPGANNAILSFANVQLSDAGNYYVIVENDFGYATSRVALLTVKLPPTLASVPDMMAEVLTMLVVSNTATDPNATPIGNLTYSLLAGAPTNASIHPQNGLFRWTPTREQARTTNLITVKVAGNGNPLLQATTSFTVVVNDYVEVSVGSTAVMTGSNSFVPIEFYSSAELSHLELALKVPPGRLANLGVEQLNPALAPVSLELPDPQTALLRFTAAAAMMQGTQNLARLNFTAVSGQGSAFLPLTVNSLGVTRAQPGPEPTLLANDGRIVVVSRQPLVEAQLTRTGQRVLAIYGTTGILYRIETTTNPASPWIQRATLRPTNIVQRLTSPGFLLGPNIFVRLRE